MGGRVMWQDTYAAGIGTSMSTAANASNGAYSGKGGFPLRNNPHLSSGQTTISNEKATGKAIRLGGTGMEYQTGHKVPSTSWQWDVTAHNIAQVLRTFFGNGVTAHTGGTYASTTYTSHLVCRQYTDANPTHFMTLVRKMSDSTAISHRMWGAVASQLQLAANENEALSVTAQFAGRDATYGYTWTSNDNDNLDTSLDSLLWKNAHIAIGHIVEGFEGFTMAVTEASATVTVVKPTAMDLTTIIEPGSYIVFESAPNRLYGPIKTVTSSVITLESAVVTGEGISATTRFKVLNMFHMSGLDLTMSNNLVSKAYDEATIHRHLFQKLTGTGTINVPFSEIPAASGGSTPGYTGSSWFNLFLGGGLVRFWVWWGNIFDAVEDSIGNGDFGMAFNIRATGDGYEDENGEGAVSIPFEMVGSVLGIGVMNTTTGSGIGKHGAYTGDGTDLIALGSEILVASEPAMGIHRGDLLHLVGNASRDEIQYVGYPGTTGVRTYFYTFSNDLGGNASTNYEIRAEAMKMKVGFGAWNLT